MAAGEGRVLVVVDVLSFTTTVGVAVERGVAVYPAAPGDVPRVPGAAVAAGRREATAERPWSLSPSAMRAAPAPSGLVLPSPNGAAISAAAGAATVVAASLRNARAVGRRRGAVGARRVGRVA